MIHHGECDFGVCSRHGKGKKCMHTFCGKARNKENTKVADPDVDGDNIKKEFREVGSKGVD
jgi:hypothetical protein